MIKWIKSNSVNIVVGFIIVGSIFIAFYSYFTNQIPMLLPWM
jgi:uncharacterized membrane protein